MAPMALLESIKQEPLYSRCYFGLPVSVIDHMQHVNFSVVGEKCQMTSVVGCLESYA